MASDVYLEAYLARGKNRRQILKSLIPGRKTQAEIHQETGIYRTHVRRSLNELMDKKLVRCLNPKDRIGKWYALTVIGKEMVKK